MHSWCRPLIHPGFGIFVAHRAAQITLRATNRHWNCGGGGVVEHLCKTDVRVINFVDTGHSALLRVWDKWQRGCRAMGYLDCPGDDGTSSL